MPNLTEKEDGSDDGLHGKCDPKRRFVTRSGPGDGSAPELLRNNRKRTIGALFQACNKQDLLQQALCIAWRSPGNSRTPRFYVQIARASFAQLCR